MILFIINLQMLINKRIYFYLFILPSDFNSASPTR